MKVTNTHYPLASSANRIALLVGLTAGTVERAEVESAILHDSQKRRWKKPVRAEGMYFESVTEAAKVLVATRHGRMGKDAFYKSVQAEVKRISRMCNADCWEGYYWEN